jgi:hypothetical protein
LMPLIIILISLSQNGGDNNCLFGSSAAVTASFCQINISYLYDIHLARDPQHLFPRDMLLASINDV